MNEMTGSVQGKQVKIYDILKYKNASIIQTEKEEIEIINSNICGCL